MTTPSSWAALGAMVALGLGVCAGVSACTSKDSTLAAVGAASDGGAALDAARATDEEGDGAAPLPRGVWEITADLTPLSPLVADATVVALGETVHTSGGYSAMRARVLRYLVETHGYRALAFEGPWGAAEGTRRYVEDGEGTLASAMEGLTFLAWRNDVTGELIAWLRGWNEAHPDDKVRFFGFDVQGPWDDGARLRRFLSDAAVNQTALGEGIRRCLGAKHDSAVASAQDSEEQQYLGLKVAMPEADRTACFAALNAVEAYLTAHATQLSGLPSVAGEPGPTALALARIAAIALRANEEQFFHALRDPVASSDGRDRGMAEVFTRLRALRAPGKRTAFWAHNRHILTRGTELRPALGDSAWDAMGSILGRELGSGYLAVALVAHQVALNWDGTRETTQEPRDGANDVEKPLADLARSPLLVDLAENDVFPAGAKYELGYYGGTGVPRDHYRALLFLERSPAQRVFQ